MWQIRKEDVLKKESTEGPKLQAENEKLRAELERVQRGGAAIADWRGFCAKCVWNGKQYLSDGKMDDRCKLAAIIINVTGNGVVLRRTDMKRLTYF